MEYLLWTRNVAKSLEQGDGVWLVQCEMLSEPRGAAGPPPGPLSDLSLPPGWLWLKQVTACLWASVFSPIK